MPNNSFTLTRHTPIYTLLFVAVAAFGACSPKSYTLDKMPMPHLSYGSGGGVTGVVSEYYLLQNGQIVEKQHDEATKSDNYRVITKIDKAEAARCLAQTDSMGLRRMIFTEPGDLYYYLTMHDANGETHKIIWGKPDKAVRPDIDKFYKTLIAFLPNNRG